MFLCGQETSFSGSTQAPLGRPSKAAPGHEASAFRPWGPGPLVLFAGEEIEACRVQTLAPEAMRLTCIHGGLWATATHDLLRLRAHLSAEAAQEAGSPEEFEGVPHILHPQVDFWLTAFLQMKLSIGLQPTG